MRKIPDLLFKMETFQGSVKQLLQRAALPDVVVDDEGREERERREKRDKRENRDQRAKRHKRERGKRT